MSCLKLRNMHAQLTKWYGNDEDKHDKVTFQLVAVDLDLVHLWSEIVVTDIVF